MHNKYILNQVHKNGFDEDEVYGAYKIFFGTLVSGSRLKIINLLRKGKLSVSEIIEEIKMPQPSVSHDLARMKKCGFVKTEIKGNYRYYSLNEKTIKPLMNLIDSHMSQHCIHILRGMNGDSKNEK